MKVTKCSLNGILLIEPSVYTDDRGFFLESYQEERYCGVGVTENFVQDNHSRSQKGVLRGLHFQVNNPQGKLVTCSRGAVYDVAVDVNPDSLTFGEYVGVELTEDNHRQFWVPPGYAHGFCVLSDSADFQYKCTDFYDPMDEGCIIWNDPNLNISWPIKNPTLSEKDANAKKLNQLEL